MPAAVREAIAALDPDRLPQGRATLAPGAAAAALENLCAAAGAPEGPVRRLLVHDASRLAGLFAGLMGKEQLGLRVEVIATDACRRLHIDRVTARLACRWRGPGTHGDLSTDGAEPLRVFLTPTGAPILLRGTLWRGGRTTGPLSRAPPIEGTGVTRPVLVPNPDEAEE